MKKIFYLIPVALLSVSGAFAQLATYAGAGGAGTTVTGIANETVSVLQTTGFGSNTACGSGGLSGLTVNMSYTSFTPTGPHAFIKILPNAGYQLNMSGFNAGMRRSGTGPACVAYAYSLDNGVTWTNDPGCHAPNNGSCGTTAVSSWTGGTLPTTLTSTTNGLIVAIFPYNASSSSGTFQINTINIAGTVTLANTAPSFTGGTSQTLTACENAVTPINTLMSITDPDISQTETWTVLSAPAHGALGGFSTTGTSTGGTITPSGLTYTPAAGYSGTDNYTIQVSDGTAVATTTVTVTVNPLPVAASITGATAVCMGSSIQLSDATPGGSWSSSNMSAATVDASGVVAGVSAATSLISYSVTNTCGTTVATTNITVNTLPTAYAVTGGGTFCAGGTGYHVGLGSSSININYQLYNGTLPVGAPLAGTASALDFGLQTTVGNYTVIAINAITGCTGNMSGSATIANYPSPVAYTITGGGASCSGAGVHVGLSYADNGITYQLYNGVTAYGTALPGNGAPLDFGLIFAGGTYTVIGTNSNACTTTMTGSTNIAVTTSVTPSVSIATGVGDTVCSGTAVTYSANAINGGTAPAYQWYTNGSPTATGSTYNYTPVNGDIISTTLTSNAACATVSSASTTVTMTVNPNQFPTVTTTLAPGNIICEGTSATFTAASTYGGLTPIFIWMQNNVAVATGASYTYLPANNDIVYCRMSSNFTCRQADTVASTATLITVQSPALPIVTVTSNAGALTTEGQFITFRADVVNGGTAPLTYQWSINGIPVPGATFITLSGNTFNNHDSVTCVVTTLSGTCYASGFGWMYVEVHPSGLTQMPGTNGIYIQPNPNSGDFTIYGTFGTATNEEVSVALVNVLGQIIYSNKINTNNGKLYEHVTLNDVSNGMYIINLHSISENKAFHLVISK